MAGLLITNIGQLVTLRGGGPRRGRALSELEIVPGGAVLVGGGVIVAAGSRRRVEKHPQARGARKLDAGGRLVTPGLVDSHTHLIFPASRAREYELRIAGASYEQIAKSGGGIMSTVRLLRRASPAELKQRALHWLGEFAAHGATTIEAKSGYGLDAASEWKTLRLLRELGREQPLDIASTLLGAHVVPPEYRGRADAYVDLLARQWIPRVAAEGLAEFCDVFCDRGAFSVAQARRVLTAGRACGLTPRIHAEQLARTGAAQLAIELHAASADHLEQLNATDIRALAKSNVCCTLLPGCCFHLGLAHYGPARKLIDAGAIVALATDFNPGTSPTLSLPMVMSLGCTQMRMTPAEALAAVTINAAYALRRHTRIGSIEPGKQADLTVWDLDDYREIPYYFGVNCCVMTVKRGKIIWRKEG
ncbi:MAG TPA: imidazolonepropionase [Candidatus Acidoferrales bacterium]